MDNKDKKVELKWDNWDTIHFYLSNIVWAIDRESTNLYIILLQWQQTIYINRTEEAKQTLKSIWYL